MRGWVQQPGHYWRDFCGEIPVDAVIGGEYEKGKNVYIIQGYVPNGGNIVGGLVEGASDVYVQYNGEILVNDSKVLCGHQQNFDWISTNRNQLRNDLRGRNPVIGGHEDEQKYLYVARRVVNGKTYIGKVGRDEGAYSELFYGVDNNRATIVQEDYDILVYTK